VQPLALVKKLDATLQWDRLLQQYFEDEELLVVEELIVLLEVLPEHLQVLMKEVLKIGKMKTQ